eukprot:g17712.t1
MVGICVNGLSLTSDRFQSAENLQLRYLKQKFGLKHHIRLGPISAQQTLKKPGSVCPSGPVDEAWSLMMLMMIIAGWEPDWIRGSSQRNDRNWYAEQILKCWNSESDEWVKNDSFKLLLQGIKQMKNKHPDGHKYVESKGEELAMTWQNALIGFRNIIDYDKQILNRNWVPFETNRRAD